MKAIGLVLLFIGAGLIVYAFSTSGPVNTAVNSTVTAANSALMQVLKSLPPGNILLLLMGGSGAVVLGMSMIFNGKNPA